MLIVDAPIILHSHSSQGSLFFAPSPVFVILPSLIMALWMMVKCYPMVALICIKSLISAHLCSWLTYKNIIRVIMLLCYYVILADLTHQLQDVQGHSLWNLIYIGHLCHLQTGMALILPFQILCLVHPFPFFSPLLLSCLIAPDNAYSTMLNFSHEFSTVLLFLLLAKKFLVLTYGLNVLSKVHGWQNEFKNKTQPYIFYQKPTSL